MRMVSQCNVPWTHRSAASASEITHLPTPEANARHNAELKWRVGAGSSPPGTPLLAADTVLDLDGKTGGKPTDLAEAFTILQALGGRSHDVVTAVAFGTAGRPPQILTSRSTVYFKPLNTETIQAYFQLVNPLDKAGAYGIQEHGGMLVDHVEGSLFNVIGLPIELIVPWLRTLFPECEVRVPDLRAIWPDAPQFPGTA